jgi:hypothetical protein
VSLKVIHARLGRLVRAWPCEPTKARCRGQRGRCACWTSHPICAVLSIHRAEVIDHAVRMNIRGHRRRTGFVFLSGGIRHAGMHGEVCRRRSCSIGPKVGMLARAFRTTCVLFTGNLRRVKYFERIEQKRTLQVATGVACTMAVWTSRVKIIHSGAGCSVSAWS